MVGLTPSPHGQMGPSLHHEYPGLHNASQLSGQALLPSLQTFPEVFFFLLVTDNKRVLSIPYMDKLKYHALKKPKAIALEIKISRQLHSQVRQLQASFPSRPPLD